MEIFCGWYIDNVVELEESGFVHRPVGVQGGDGGELVNVGTGHHCSAVVPMLSGTAGYIVGCEDESSADGNANELRAG